MFAQVKVQNNYFVTLNLLESHSELKLTKIFCSNMGNYKIYEKDYCFCLLGSNNIHTCSVTKEWLTICI